MFSGRQYRSPGQRRRDLINDSTRHPSGHSSPSPHVDLGWTFSSLPCSLGRTPFCRASCECHLGTREVIMWSPSLHAGTPVARGGVWASAFSKLHVVLTCSQGREPLLWENFAHPHLVTHTLPSGLLLEGSLLASWKRSGRDPWQLESGM